jgi:hypothetical protein
VQWPIALATLRVRAAGAWLHPQVSEFSYVPELPKLSCAIFVFEQTRGEGMGCLARLFDEEEWMPVAGAMDLLARIHTEWRLPISDVHPIMMEN